MKRLVIELDTKLHKRFLKVTRERGTTASFVIRNFCEDYSSDQPAKTKNPRKGATRNPGFSAGEALPSGRS